MDIRSILNDQVPGQELAPSPQNSGSSQPKTSHRDVQSRPVKTPERQPKTPVVDIAPRPGVISTIRPVSQRLNATIQAKPTVRGAPGVTSVTFPSQLVAQVAVPAHLPSQVPSVAPTKVPNQSMSSSRAQAHVPVPSFNRPSPQGLKAKGSTLSQSSPQGLPLSQATTTTRPQPPMSNLISTPHKTQVTRGQPQLDTPPHALPHAQQQPVTQTQRVNDGSSATQASEATRLGRSKGNLIFYLIPKNQAAMDIINLNPNHREILDGRPVISCYSNRQSKVEGRLLSFGRNSYHDIRLPASAADIGRPQTTDQLTSDDGTRKPGRSYQNYRNDHFFFALTPSGELILRDLSPCLTTLEVGGNPEPSNAVLSMHALHGTNPRQRVIPRSSRIFFISFGTSTSFTLRWARGYQGIMDDSIYKQGELVKDALHRQLGGMSLTVPSLTNSASGQPVVGRQSRDLRSHYTPSIGSSSGLLKPLYLYYPVGKGGFGRVFKAVDLNSGELWAVKELEIPLNATDHNIWRASFLNEAKVLEKVRHKNIVHFECYQDFRIGGSFQLVFRLYQGSLSEFVSKAPMLLQSVAASKTDPLTIPPPTYWSRLVSQMSSALDYLHGENILHRDIKPSNIMYSIRDKDVYDFFLGDFGLSVTDDSMRGTGAKQGTLLYMAPEIYAQPRHLASKAADIWSLGMTFCRVWGWWHEAAWDCPRSDWCSHLRSLGCELNPYREPSDNPFRWRFRMQALGSRARLPVLLKKMLSKDANHRPTAGVLKAAPISQFTQIPASPSPVSASQLAPQQVKQQNQSLQQKDRASTPGGQSEQTQPQQLRQQQHHQQQQQRNQERPQARYQPKRQATSQLQKDPREHPAPVVHTMEPTTYKRSAK